MAQEELFIESLYENENQYMLLAKDGDEIIAVGSIAEACILNTERKK